MQWNFSQNVWDSNIIFHSAIKAGNVFLSFHFVSFRYALLCFGNFVFDFDAENAFVKLRRWPRCVCVSNWSIWWLLLQFHILYVKRGLCQLHFTCQRIVSFWSFFRIHHNWYACHIFCFSSSTGTDISHCRRRRLPFISLTWNFFHAIQLSFFIHFNPYHRKTVCSLSFAFNVKIKRLTEFYEWCNLIIFFLSIFQSNETISLRPISIYYLNNELIHTLTILTFST